MDTTEKKPKAPKAPKAPEVKDPATVGPVEGEIESTPDTPALPVAPAKKATKDSGAVVATLEGQFKAIKATLMSTHSGAKQVRQLRWALKSLDAAEDAAMRHIRLNG